MNIFLFAICHMLECKFSKRPNLSDLLMINSHPTMLNIYIYINESKWIIKY